MKPRWDLVRAKRTLFADAIFNIESTEPITYLHLAREMTVDGVLEALTLEAHGTAALQVEHLKTGDVLDTEYSSHWPHRVYVDSPAGVYTERGIIRRIWGLSRPAPVPLRKPLAKIGTWGPFELAVYSQHLASVRGHW
jgi:hypothetical protein